MLGLSAVGRVVFVVVTRMRIGFLLNVASDTWVMFRVSWKEQRRK
jgi:hypothetical protein